MTSSLQEIVSYLDDLLDTKGVPDYPGALNGLQFENIGAIHKIAAAVDFSSRAINGAIEHGANLLLVHHGMFWGGIKPVVGITRDRIRRLIEHDIAVYSSHLPLDRHPDVGNNVLLAKELELDPTHPFAAYNGTTIGFRGSCDLESEELGRRVSEFSHAHGGTMVTSASTTSRHISSWAVCTGAGASAETIDEAIENGVDALIVGEGPHWTAVEADEHGLIIFYAGHYATETLGVRALAKNLAQRFSLEWTWVRAATGL
jgi:dinuclear metal center YbgI/SA1388 family protein